MQETWSFSEDISEKDTSSYQEIISRYIFVDVDKIKSSWRKKAMSIMIEVLLNDDIPDKNKIKEIDKRYPWGQRSNHPYKIWLQERKLAIEAIGEKYLKGK